MTCTDRYMAVPFVKRGRSFEGADCAGLYLLFVANEGGLMLSAPAELGFDTPLQSAAAIEGEIMSGRWIEIWRRGPGADLREAKLLARRFDCVVMTAHVRDNEGRLHSRELHLGCAIGNGEMLHTELETGPQLVPIDDSEIAHRVRAIYRPAALAEVA